MKKCLFLAGLISTFCLFHHITAAPAEPVTLDLEETQSILQNEEPLPELNRQKRATCDLLSAFPFSGASCAAHCVFLGKRGGHCNDRGVCECSSKKLKW